MWQRETGRTNIARIPPWWEQVDPAIRRQWALVRGMGGCACWLVARGLWAGVDNAVQDQYGVSSSSRIGQALIWKPFWSELDEIKWNAALIESNTG